jgi:signal transduction histidine kinase
MTRHVVADASGRDTVDVSELPPPPPPGPTVGPAHSTTASSPAPDDGWDWDRAKDLAERWFRPLADSAGWLALGYLFFGAIAAPFVFGIMVAAAAVTFALLFVAVGFFLIVPVFSLVQVFGRLERHLAAIAGHEIELREPRSLTGTGLRAPLLALTDPVRWRYVGFIAVNLVLAPVLFGFGSFPLSFVLQAVLGDGVLNGPGFSIGTGVNPGALGILALPLAAFFAGAIPRVALWMASLKAQIGNWFIGTDRLAAAEQRVSALSTQRSEILDAVASERRRIERNLHDGVQQQLVAIGLDLGMAEQQIDRDPERARELIGNARSKVQGSIGELRQLGRGLHPAILEDRGIDAALSAVVSGSSIPISVQVDPELDLSTDVSETVYFVANEAIANVLKHAGARVASVHVVKVAANVRVTIHDDGVGGVDATKGTGVAGIRARVNAVDGTLTIVSPPGGPTTLTAEIPRR